VARPLLALAASWPMVLSLRVLDRFGKGLRSSPRDALLARSVPPARRGIAFGLHRAFDNAGAVVGPLLAAGLLAWNVPLRDILLWAAVPGALCVALALSVKEPRDDVAVAQVKPDWTWRGLPPGFRRLLAAISIFTLGQASNAFVILRAHDLGMPTAQTALLWAVVAATSTLLAVPLSAHSDRVGRVPLLAVGWVLHVVLFVVLGWTSSADLMWPAAILLGVYMAATEGSERALIADLVPQERLGTAYGWYYLAKGLLLLPASAVFGWLWATSGATAAFMLAASFVALATLALVVWVLPAVRHAHRGSATS
jgi:MFS family permease